MSNLSQLYIRRPTDDQLYDHLHNGNHCYVFSPPKMGKTCLLNSLKLRLIHETLQPPKRPVQCAVIALRNCFHSTESTKHTEVKCYKILIENLVKDYDKTYNKSLSDDLENIWKYLDEERLLEDFLEKILLKKTQSDVVIFIDEFDSLFELKFSSHKFPEKFLKSLQDCIQEPKISSRITFAIFSRKLPYTYLQKLPIGLSIINIPDFQEKNLKEWSILSEKCNNSEKVVTTIFKWTNGQPLLTYGILNTCLKLSDSSASRGKGEVSIENIDNIIESKKIFTDDSIKPIFDIIEQQISNNIELLNLYKQIICEKPIPYTKTSEQNKLLNLGLLINSNKKLVIHNETYKKRFDQAWIDKKIKDFQQREITSFQNLLKKIDEFQNILLPITNLVLFLSSFFFILFSRILGFLLLMISVLIGLVLWKPSLAEGIRNYTKNPNNKFAKLFSIIRNYQKPILLFIIVVLILIVISPFHLIERKGKEILKMKDGNVNIELLESAIKNGQDLQQLHLVNRIPLLRKAMPTSPLLALQQVYEKIKESNRLELNNKEKIMAIGSFQESPSNKIVAGGEYGTLRVWCFFESKDCKSKPINTKQTPIKSLSVSSDGKRIATGGPGGKVKLWDVSESSGLKESKQLRECGDETVESLDFNKNGGYLAAGTRNGKLCVWDLSNENQLKPAEVDEPRNRRIKKISFIPNSNSRKSDYIATASASGVIKFYSLEKDEGTTEIKLKHSNWKPHNTSEEDNNDSYIQDFSFNKKGSQIITAGKDGKIKVWKLKGIEQEPQQLYEWTIFDRSNAPHHPFILVSFDQDNDQWIAVFENNNILNFSELKTRHTCLIPSEQENSNTSSQDKECPKTDNILRTYGSDHESIHDIGVFTDYKITTVITGGKEAFASIWNLERLSKLTLDTWNPQGDAEITSLEIRAYDQSTQSFYVLGLNDKNEVVIWDKHFGPERDPDLEDLPPSMKIATIKFKHQKLRFVTGSQDGKLRFWDYILEGKPNRTIDVSHQGNHIIQIGFSPKDNLFVVAYDNGTVKLFVDDKAKEDIPIRSGPNIKFIQFSKDGKYLVLAGGKYASVWKISANQEIQKSDGKELRDENVSFALGISSVAFTPNGDIAISSKNEDKISLWNTSGKYRNDDFNLNTSDVDQLSAVYGFSFGKVNSGLFNLFNANPTLLATAVHKKDQNTNIIQVWDWVHRKLIAEFKSSLETINTIRLPPDDQCGFYRHNCVIVGGKGNASSGELFKLYNLKQLLEESRDWLTHYQDYRAINESE
ncbi:MAG: WD40 repeat domain-containing protein [Crocosphaera sp.]|nr:WD40 repeat domain-containing protein [Crocosphaera sp.]